MVQSKKKRLSETLTSSLMMKYTCCDITDPSEARESKPPQVSVGLTPALSGSDPPRHGDSAATIRVIQTLTAQT